MKCNKFFCQLFFYFWKNHNKKYQWSLQQLLKAIKQIDMTHVQYDFKLKNFDKKIFRILQSIFRFII